MVSPKMELGGPRPPVQQEKEDAERVCRSCRASRPRCKSPYALPPAPFLPRLVRCSGFALSGHVAVGTEAYIRRVQKNGTTPI